MTTAQPEPTPVGTAPDPAKHVLSVTRSDRHGMRRPITLTCHAQELRRELADDHLWPNGPGRPARNVVVTEVRAVVIASLLEELAARLLPGPAFGAGTDGQELARVVADLAAELLDQALA